jgi:hypothetical protein
MGMPNFNMNAAMGVMATAQTVFDVAGSYDAEGLWRSNQLSDRTIRATVLNADVQKISIMTNGNVTSGGLVIHTKSTLYYQDAMSFEYVSEMKNSPGIKALAFGTPTRGQNTPEAKQSFIRYKGRVFRIMGEGFPNANYNTYIAVRYLDYGSDKVAL